MNCRFGMIRGAACAVGNVAYFNPGGTPCVYFHDYQTKQWGELPRCPTSQFALVVINGQLTTVGGTNSSKLFGFSKAQWKQTFPQMSTNREYAAAVCTGHYVVVAGGHDGHEALASVEVMDTNTRQWFTAASLPRGIYRASMTTCGDTLYLSGDKTTEVHYCSLITLLQSCEVPTNQAALWTKIKSLIRPSAENPPSSQQANVWMRLKALPVCESTALTLCGQLVSVGGYEEKHRQAVDNVYFYNPLTSSWKVIGRIPSGQSCILAATLPGDKLIIVTGVEDISIDMVSCVIREL